MIDLRELEAEAEDFNSLGKAEFEAAAARAIVFGLIAVAERLDDLNAELEVQRLREEF